jgi:hypothetical protein
MGIGKKARSAETQVGRVVDNLVERLVGPSPRQPIEIVHALLEDLERLVQPAGRGRWVLPCNRLTVEFAAPSRETKAQLMAVVGGPDALRARIAEHLRSICTPGPLDIRIRFRPIAPATWERPDYHLELEQVDRSAVATAPVTGDSAIELFVVQGACDRRRFTFTAERIDIGRGAEVIDSRQRLLRRNQIVFNDDGTDPNQTVSRRHAHILYQPSSREYRLHDDNSSRGTSIIRKGTTIPVPSGSRGVGLQSGDEVILGQARLRIRIERKNS